MASAALTPRPFSPAARPLSSHPIQLCTGTPSESGPASPKPRSCATTAPSPSFVSLATSSSGAASPRPTGTLRGAPSPGSACELASGPPQPAACAPLAQPSPVPGGTPQYAFPQNAPCAGNGGSGTALREATGAPSLAGVHAFAPGTGLQPGSLASPFAASSAGPTAAYPSLAPSASCSPTPSFVPSSSCPPAPSFTHGASCSPTPSFTPSASCPSTPYSGRDGLAMGSCCTPPATSAPSACSMYTSTPASVYPSGGSGALPGTVLGALWATTTHTGKSVRRPAHLPPNWPTRTQPCPALQGSWRHHTPAPSRVQLSRTPAARSITPAPLALQHSPHSRKVGWEGGRFCGRRKSTLM